MDIVIFDIDSSENNFKKFCEGISLEFCPEKILSDNCYYAYSYRGIIFLWKKEEGKINLTIRIQETSSLKEMVNELMTLW